jgi:hypothetical protein
MGIFVIGRRSGSSFSEGHNLEQCSGTFFRKIALVIYLYKIKG